uniref:RGS domain-containing protein n=1 Tax=Parastrongyloides trichosuri TaxID=131310 RepID=A0A0N4ZM67_PARTI
MNSNGVLHRQFILLYHGYTNVSSNFNSFILEQTISVLKKDSPVTTTVSLELLDFNIVVKTSYNSEILNSPYSQFCDYVKSYKSHLYLGLIFKGENEDSKRCYIFSIDPNLSNHQFHSRYNYLFNFQCSQSHSIYGECDQFPEDVEQIIDSTNFFRNVLSTDYIESQYDGIEEDVSPIHEEFLGNRQKRKIEENGCSSQLSVKKTSIDNGPESTFQYSECYYVKSTNEEEGESRPSSASSSHSTSSYFYKTLSDETLRKPFMKYLEEQFCQENLLFYVVVQEYKLMFDFNERVTKGQQIVQDHLEEDAPNQINIDNKTRIDIMLKISQKNFSIDLFDKAQFQITEMMKFDLWPRYLKLAEEKHVEVNHDTSMEEKKHGSKSARLSLHNLKNKLLSKKFKKSLDGGHFLWNFKSPRKNEESFPFHLDIIGKSFRSGKRESVGTIRSDTLIEKDNCFSRSLSINEIKSLHEV